MKEIASIEDVPPQKDVWLHEKSGNLYRIVGFGIMEETLVPVVSYAPAHGPHGAVWGQHGAVWVRPCTEFFDGRFRQMKPKVKINKAWPVPPAGESEE